MIKFLEKFTPQNILELFIIVNYGFLILDIFYAHSINSFSHHGEWIPLIFSMMAVIFLLINFLVVKINKKIICYLVAFFSIVVGTVGIYFHLESQFFQNTSLRSLIYTAPLIAPLAYSGLGLLLFLNSILTSTNKYYGIWIIVISYMGFVGNFFLSLLDHAQNGFFYFSEWIPVISSAMAMIFIPICLNNFCDKRYNRIIFFILSLQIFVGILGFLFHLYPIFQNKSQNIIELILYGPPILAPLLFCNLSLLMGFGIWCQQTSRRN